MGYPLNLGIPFLCVYVCRHRLSLGIEPIECRTPIIPVDAQSVRVPRTLSFTQLFWAGFTGSPRVDNRDNRLKGQLQRHFTLARGAKGRGAAPFGNAPVLPLNEIKLKGRLAVRFSRRKSSWSIFIFCVVNLSL